MVGKTVIISEKVSSSYYATTNPGGTISLVSANSYTRTASVASGQSAMGTLAWSATAYSEYTTGGDYITGVAGTVTATPAVGYVFDYWSGDTSVSGVTVSGNKVTVAKNAAAQDIALVAHFSKKTASDGYNIYIRWTSTYSTSQGGAEVTRQHRVVKNNDASTTALRIFTSDTNTALSAIEPKSGVAVTRKSTTSGSSTVYYANYFPIDDGGDYWVGRNVGAKRSGSYTLGGWNLRGVANGNVLATLPPDASSTIAQIAAILDAAPDADAPFYNNGDGNYRMAFLEAVWGELHGITVSTSGTNIDSPEVSASPGSALEGATVTLTAQTDNLATCQFSEWSITYVEDGTTKTITPTPTGTAGQVTFAMPNFAVTATAVYESKLFSLSVTNGGGGSASVVKRGTAESPDASELVYGLELTLKATASQGFSFSGWYLNGSTTRESASANYDVTLTGDLSAVAKFNAPVVFSVSAESNSGGYIVVDGDEHATETTFTVQREVGAPVAIRAVTTSGHFVGWKKNGSSVELQAEDSITVEASASTAYTAVFAEDAPQFIVGISNVDDDDENASSPGYVVLSGQTVEELSTDDRATYAPNFSDCDTVYRVTGTAPVVYTVYKTGDKNFKNLSWAAESPTSSGGASILSPAQNSVEVVSGSKAFYEDGIWTSHWGETSATTISAESGNPANGTVSVTGGTDAAGDGGHASAKFMPNDVVTLSAAPANGYLFGGWYYHGTKVSASATFTFTFDENTGSDYPYVAQFEQDTDAIFEWEGSTENKQMEWRSKVYTAPKPFDPVAARVDATGYSPAVSLNVGTMSSPNAEPTREHEILVSSQDGRRLPRMRPERFVRFTVKSTHEIDAVVIGTNMAEVN